MSKKLKTPPVMQQIPFDMHRNDLFASIQCECPNKAYKGSAIAKLMKTKIKIYGYNDNYFFNVVNKEPRILSCDCGRKYQYQWTPDHVNVIPVEA